MNYRRPLAATVWKLLLAMLLAACAPNSPTPAQPSPAPSSAPSSAASTPAPPSPAAATPLPPAPTVAGNADQAALAKSLADRLANAAGDQARTEALLAVMQALHIGVYTPGGQTMVRGAERGPNDFYRR